MNSKNLCRQASAALLSMKFVVPMTVTGRIRALLMLFLCVFTAESIGSAVGTYVPPEIRSVYTPMPHNFTGARIYSVTFKTDPEALEGILPDNFRPVPGYENYVSILFNLMESPESLIRPYHEAIIAVPAILETKDGDIVGRYNVQLYLGSTSPESNVAPTTAGQMLIGYPKREAIFQIEGEFGGKHLEVRMERYNSKIFEATYKTYSESPKRAEANLPPNGPGFVLKAIQSVDEKAWDVLQVNTTSEVGMEGCKPVKLHESKRAEVTISGDIVLDTGRVIPVKEIVDVTYKVIDFCSTSGRTLHDYLAQ